MPQEFPPIMASLKATRQRMAFPFRSASLSACDMIWSYWVRLSRRASKRWIYESIGLGEAYAQQLEAHEAMGGNRSL